METLGGPILIAQMAGQQAQEGFINLVVLPGAHQRQSGGAQPASHPHSRWAVICCSSCWKLSWGGRSTLVKSSMPRRWGWCCSSPSWSFVFYNDIVRLLPGAKKRAALMPLKLSQACYRILMKILAVDTSTSVRQRGAPRWPAGDCGMGLDSAQTHNRRLLTPSTSCSESLGWTLDWWMASPSHRVPAVSPGFASASAPSRPWPGCAANPMRGFPPWMRWRRRSSMPANRCVRCSTRVNRKSTVPSTNRTAVAAGSVAPLPGWRPRLPSCSEIHGPTLFCGDGWLLYREWFAKELGDLGHRTSGAVSQCARQLRRRSGL